MYRPIRYPSAWTINELERRYPGLFYQLERQLGRKVAGRILLGVAMGKLL